MSRRKGLGKSLTVCALAAGAAGVPALLLIRVPSVDVEVLVQTRQAQLNLVRPATLKLSTLTEVKLLRVLHPTLLRADKECVRMSSGSESVAFMPSGEVSGTAFSLSDLDLLAGDRLSLQVDNDMLWVSQERPRQAGFGSNPPIELAFEPASSAALEVLSQPPANDACVFSAERILAKEPTLLAVQARVPRSGNSNTSTLIDSELSVEAVDFEEHLERNIAGLNVVADQSALVHASIRFQWRHAEPIELGSGEPLHLVAQDAKIFELHSGSPWLGLRLAGTLSVLEGRRPVQNLMPTRLEALRNTQGFMLWWSAALYVFGLGIGFLKLLGYWKETS